MRWLRRFAVFVLPLVFLLISLFTLYDYGVNWDSLQHFVRGQIYYQYLTTGKKYFTSQKSYYESAALDFAWTEKMTIGHPPLTDILLAASNRLFYQTLGWTADIQGYHLYIVLVTFFMACVVAVWSYQLFGLFPSIVSVIALYTYPLLFAEQHFNQKDPAVAAYFTGCLYFLWLGVVKKKPWLIGISALFAGLSLGTKFDILFAAPIVGIWLLFYIQKRKISGTVLAAIVGIPIIAFVLFFVTYPALWSDPINKVISVINYYRDIGGSRCYYPMFSGQWFWTCTDLHTIRLYITTLPLITVALSVIGGLWAVKKIGEDRFAPFLWVVWLTITLGRATVPITSLYGGSLRQIMEFIPATALLTGAGVYIFIKKYKILILFLYIPVILQMISLHPNENLYYNVLAGGLPGAVRLGYPVPINTYGNGYKQAIDWINNNAPTGATVYLLEGITSAVPSIQFRPDIQYKGSAPYLSVFDGSYLLELTQPGMDITMYHNSKYAAAFLTPIFQKKVDGVAIVSVWKNDVQHANTVFDFTKEVSVIPRVTSSMFDQLVLDLGRDYMVKRLEMRTTDPKCETAVNSLYTFLSTDGISFKRMLNPSANFSQASGENHTAGAFIFTGQITRFIKLYSFADNKCDLSSVNYSVVVFP